MIYFKTINPVINKLAFVESIDADININLTIHWQFKRYSFCHTTHL